MIKEANIKDLNSQINSLQDELNKLGEEKEELIKDVKNAKTDINKLNEILNNTKINPLVKIITKKIHMRIPHKSNIIIRCLICLIIIVIIVIIMISKEESAE